MWCPHQHEQLEFGLQLLPASTVLLLTWKTPSSSVIGTKPPSSGYDVIYTEVCWFQTHSPVWQVNSAKTRSPNQEWHQSSLVSSHLRCSCNRHRTRGGAESGLFLLEAEAEILPKELICSQKYFISSCLFTHHFSCKEPCKAETFWHLKQFNTLAWKRFNFLI